MTAPDADAPYGAQPPDVSARLNELEAVLAHVLNVDGTPNENLNLIRFSGDAGDAVPSPRRTLAAFVMGAWKP